MRFLRLIVLGLSASGLLAVLVAFCGDWHWYADLFAHLRPQYCVWLGLAAVGGLLLRHRLALILALVGLFANAVALAPYALPWRDGDAGPGRGRVWTLVSVNLLYGNRDVSAVIGYLRRVQADIVVLQEVSPPWELALDELRDLYPHRSFQARKDQFGVAVFSREPPVEIAIRAVGNRAGDLAILGTWESEGRRFSVAGVHPDKPDEEWKTRNRAVYLGRIAQWCEGRASANEPVVVIGDFNATPWSASMRSFTRDTKLRNTSQGTIFGATWNVWEPHRLLIDHAFLSSHWTLLNREVGPAVGSDHRPLLIRAALRPK